MAKRRHQTIADWAAIGLCPSLIVLLISSLVYFLIMCLYRDTYTGRIGYIWFCFIVGAVGIARISIQESRKYAMGYAAVLGLATWGVLSQFIVVRGPLSVFSPILNAAIIALVWFLADRITFDCTLIDEDKDASGQGLLDGLTDDGAGEHDQQQHATRKRGHQPGRTVLWLTAAALPIFGLGQWMLPQDERWQHSALLALGTYLFAALALLVATSFLGVRRYLRQRGVDMPSDVSTAWLAGGIVMIVLMLLVCLMLPQPGQMLATMELPETIESPDWLKPSRYGWGGEGTNPDATQPSAATTPATEPGQSTDSSGQSMSSQTNGQGGSQAGAARGQQSESANSTKTESGAAVGSSGQSSSATGDAAQGGGQSSPASNSPSAFSSRDTSSAGKPGSAPNSPADQGGSPSSTGDKSPRTQASAAQESAAATQSSASPSTSQEQGSAPESQAAATTGASNTDGGSSNKNGESPASKGAAKPNTTSQAGDSSSNAAEQPSSKPPTPEQPTPPATAQSDAAQSDAAQSDAAQADASQADAVPADASPESPMPSLSDWIGSLTTVIRYLIIAALLAVIAFFLWVHRQEIARAWEALLAWLRGEAVPQSFAVGEVASQPTRSLLPFSAFRNPLVSGSDPKEAIIVTYQAAEAWWRERGQPRLPGETPSEFCRRLKAVPALDHSAWTRLTDAYNRIVYGNDTVHSADLDAAAAVWRSFGKGP